MMVILGMIVMNITDAKECDTGKLGRMEQVTKAHFDNGLSFLLSRQTNRRQWSPFPNC